MCTSLETAEYILSEACDVSNIVGAYVKCVKEINDRNIIFEEYFLWGIDKYHNFVLLCANDDATKRNQTQVR